MDDDAGGVDDRPQRAAELRGQSLRRREPRCRAAAAAPSHGRNRAPPRPRSRSASPPPHRVSAAVVAAGAMVTLEQATRGRCRSCSMDGITRKSGTGTILRCPGRQAPRHPRRTRATVDARHPRHSGTRLLLRSTVPWQLSGTPVRSNVSGRMPSIPKSPRPRSSPRSIRICTRRSSAARPPVLDHARVCPVRRRPTTRAPWTWRAPRPSIARSASGDAFRHRARFFPGDALQLRDLFEIVGAPARHRSADRRSPDPLRARAVAAALWFLLCAEARGTATRWLPRPASSTARCSSSRPRSNASKRNTTCSSPAACRGCRGRRARGSRRIVKRYDRMHDPQHRRSAFASGRCRRASPRSASCGSAR